MAKYWKVKRSKKIKIIVIRFSSVQALGEIQTTFLEIQIKKICLNFRSEIWGAEQKKH
jgi:hypothetical protein